MIVNLKELTPEQLIGLKAINDEPDLQTFADALVTRFADNAFADVKRAYLAATPINADMVQTWMDGKVKNDTAQ